MGKFNWSTVVTWVLIAWIWAFAIVLVIKAGVHQW